MTTFVCPRCGKEIKTRSSLKAHILRKTLCEPIISNLSVDELLIEFEFKKEYSKTFECVYCKRKYTFQSGVTNHQRMCEKKSSASHELISLHKQLKHIQKRKKDLLEAVIVT